MTPEKRPRNDAPRESAKDCKCQLQETCKQFQYLSRPNGGAKARLLYRFMGDARKPRRITRQSCSRQSSFFLPTSEELTQNLCIATAGIPSGVTGDVTFSGYAT
jgi:hypothetical protein